MRIFHRAIAGALGLLACQSPQVYESTDTQTPVVESTASTGTNSSSGGDSTTATGGLCDSGDFEILGQCYHSTEVPSIRSAFRVAAADFNGDQDIDLAMGCRGTDSGQAICLWSQNGNVQKLDLTWSPGVFPEVYAGRFDADGISDIFVSGYDQFSAIKVVPSGALVEQDMLQYDPDIHDHQDSPMFPAIPINLDQDGRSEVITGSGYHGIRLWRYNTMTATWEPSGDRQPLFGCGDLADAGVVDLDNDTTPEFVALGSHNNCDANIEPGSGWNRISVFTTKSNAVELSPVIDFPAVVAARRFDVADFAGDTAPDLIVADAANMMLFRGNGDGTFETPIPIPGLASFAGTEPHAGDFDADGIDELVVEQADGSYDVLVGFPDPQIVELPATLGLITLVADLNQDGHADFVSVAFGGDNPLVVTLSVP